MSRECCRRRWGGAAHGASTTARSIATARGCTCAHMWASRPKQRRADREPPNSQTRCRPAAIARVSTGLAQGRARL
eukprot:2300442-Prymnesium_polylepis.1